MKIKCEQCYRGNLEEVIKDEKTGKFYYICRNSLGKKILLTEEKIDLLLM